MQMEPWIGGTRNCESGIGGEALIEKILEEPIQFGIYFLGLIAALIILRMIYVWMFIIRLRKPKIEADWRPDCKFHGEAIIDGTKITFKNVRDFFWRTTKDYDENWVDEITVDSEEIKDIWFVVDHFHSITGLAHTLVTIEFNDGMCLSFSFDAFSLLPPLSFRRRACGLVVLLSVFRFLLCSSSLPIMF